MPVHLDDPARSVTLPDGRIISNLSGPDYDATYAEGAPCAPVPAEVLAAIYAKLGHDPEVTS